MTQITKREFIETLSNNETILAASVFRQSDERCINAMEKITTINKKCQTQNRNRTT